MFDNFGLGEFFFLALLALLFFGPERLPQMGARLGRWVGNLTQYSKAFMTEWRDEALAIHDAVEEVKGIRDEIVAAQREISGTLDTARGDMEDGLDAAKEAVTGATRDVTTRIQQQRFRAAQDFDQLSEAESGAETTGSGTDAAIDRTQEIVAGLEKRRAPSRRAPVEDAAPGAADAATEAGGETPAAEAVEGVPSETEASGSGSAGAGPGDEEWEKIHRLIEEGMKPKRPAEQAQAEETAAGKPAAAPAAGSGPASQPPTTRTTAPGSGTTQGAPADGSEAQAEKAPEPPRESAFDRTQKVLESLRKRRAGIPEESSAADETAQAATEPAAEPEPEGTPPTPRETAFDRTQQVLQSLKRKREGRDQGSPVKAALPPVNRDDFERLSREVVTLRDQMEALRNELRVLRALASHAGATTDDVSIEEVT